MNSNPDDARFSDVLLWALGTVWGLVRLPVLGLLIVLEPFVCAGLTILGALLVFTALFFHYLTRVPDFPFWGMLGCAAGCGVVLILYYGAIRIFSTPLQSVVR